MGHVACGLRGSVTVAGGSSIVLFGLLLLGPALGQVLLHARLMPFLPPKEQLTFVPRHERLEMATRIHLAACEFLSVFQVELELNSIPLLILSLSFDKTELSLAISWHVDGQR